MDRNQRYKVDNTTTYKNAFNNQELLMAIYEAEIRNDIERPEPKLEDYPNFTEYIRSKNKNT